MNGLDASALIIIAAAVVVVVIIIMAFLLWHFQFQTGQELEFDFYFQIGDESSLAGMSHLSVEFFNVLSK